MISIAKMMQYDKNEENNDSSPTIQAVLAMTMKIMMKMKMKMTMTSLLAMTPLVAGQHDVADAVEKQWVPGAVYSSYNSSSKSLLSCIRSIYQRTFVDKNTCVLAVQPWDEEHNVLWQRYIISNNKWNTSKVTTTNQFSYLPYQQSLLAYNKQVRRKKQENSFFKNHENLFLRIMKTCF